MNVPPLPLLHDPLPTPSPLPQPLHPSVCPNFHHLSLFPDHSPPSHASNISSSKRKSQDDSLHSHHIPPHRPPKVLKIDVEKCPSFYNLAPDHPPCPSPVESQNFHRTGLPCRFLFYDNGDWKDYPKDVATAISVCFMAHKTSFHFSLRGTTYAVNFLYMLQLNTHTGYVRSVAWIDHHGKCFSPQDPIQGHGDRLISPKSQTPLRRRIHLSASELRSLIIQAQRGDSLETPADSSAGTAADFNHLHGERLVKLEEGDDGFEFVKERLLSGLSVLSKHTTITGIYRNSHHNCATGKARFQAFKTEEEVTRQLRGDANVKYAWHGTSKDGVNGILRHGFGQTRAPKNGSVYGVGVYLAPEEFPHISAMYSDVDENGEQHMMLCSVVLGRMEQVHRGSDQFHPSSEEYDSGVDDMESPRRYVIWSTHMNTRILPEFVVSFKLAPLLRAVMVAAMGGKNLRECLPPAIDNAQDKQEQESCKLDPATSNSCRYPHSPWISFPELFTMMEATIDPADMTALRQEYLIFQAGKMSREAFVKRIRARAGDGVLRECLERKMLEAR